MASQSVVDQLIDEQAEHIKRWRKALRPPSAAGGTWLHPGAIRHYRFTCRSQAGEEGTLMFLRLTGGA